MSGARSPKGPGPDSPPNPPSERAGLHVELHPRSPLHGIYVHHELSHLGPGAPRVPGSRLSPPQRVTIGQLSNGAHALMEFTFTTNFHIWGQGPPGPGPSGTPGPGPKASGLLAKGPRPEPQAPRATPTRKLTNLQSYKLTNLQTYKLTNLQNYKLTNLQTYKVCKASLRRFLTWLQTL